MQKFYAALLFGLLFFLPSNSLLAQETITSTASYIDFSGSGFADGINYIQITTGIECQGIFEEQIFTSAQIYVSPMPFTDQLTIFVGGLDNNLNLELYTSNGRLIERHQKQLRNGNRTLSLNTTHLKPGSYVLKTIGKTTLTSELIIKEKLHASPTII